MSPPGASIRECAEEDLAAVRPLWEGLYAHQRASGLVASLSDDGFDRWAASLGPTLGRFSCVLVAESDGTPIGFLAGRVRTPTPPFEPRPTGFISEVFVAEGYRRAGAAGALIAAAERWFSDQGVERLELQVLVENRLARDAYRRMGWQDELVQMVRTLPPAP